LRFSSSRKPFTHPIPSEFSYILVKFSFLFGQCGDRCSLACLFCCRLFFGVLPSPTSKTILIGHILMNRQNAANCWLCFPFLIIFVFKAMHYVSPAYSNVSLALVKCSDEGGPGPRYNRKEVPGSSTLTMLVVHGYHLYLMPLFSEAGDQETSIVGPPPPPPPPDQPGQSPLPPPSGTYSTPCKDEDRCQPRWKSHFSL
jgi:hypothetical protein